MKQEIDRQQVAHEMLNAHPIENMSMIMDYILSKSWDDPDTPYAWDSDVQNLRPDVDSMDIEECEEWIKDNMGDGEGPQREEYMGEDEDEEDPELDEDGYLEALQEYIRDNAEDAEVFEWYSVDSWLVNQLEQRGEVVIDGFNAFWGRTCTGQSVVLDCVIQDIAEEWKKIQ